MENKMNWGTLILGIVVGAVVVGIVWAASKPAVSGAAGQSDYTCKVLSNLQDGETVGGVQLDPHITDILNTALEPVINVVCN